MGLKEFAQHIYQYFASDAPSPPKQVVKTEVPSVSSYIPVYDTRGNLLRYIEVVSSEPHGNEISIAKPDIKPVLVDRSLNGPISATKELPPLPVIPKSTSSTVNSTIWDGWPDGPLELDFNLEEYIKTSKLRVHWAIRINGGYSGNKDSNAASWEDGLKIRRVCLGVIECENPECRVVIRPKVKAALLDQQLREDCKCGAPVYHSECAVISFLFTWARGCHFTQTGYHTHRRPTHTLHLMQNEKHAFEALVKENPQSGPLQLVVGVPGLEGPGKSSADISDVLVNSHRVAKERLKIKHGLNTQTGDGLIALFSEFDRKHPGFIIHNNIGTETVISMQSTFMRSQLVKKERIDEPINGLVSDAAHGFWKERNSLLMITSGYGPKTQCWVPGVMSYTNGATAEHFHHHFLAVINSIAVEAEKQGLPLTDELFAGIMDFSEAERLGFIRAYITFHQNSGDTRTPQELQVAAERLLRGCREHYRAGITRLSRMHSAIPPDLCETFKSNAIGLLDLPSSEEFINQATSIVSQFPDIKDWMKWWMRPAVASMLFESERKMDADLWKSLPETTNAEESMHFKIYKACGRDHQFLEGLHSLFAIAVYFERQYDNAGKGTLIRYGMAEPWKNNAKKFGYTKPTRADRPENKKRKKNDGRPPDTLKELFKAQKKRKTLAITPDLIYGPQSYTWTSNSCWLDSSLHIIYMSLYNLLDDLSPLFSELPNDSTLGLVFSHLLQRRDLEQTPAIDVEATLGKERKHIRTVLVRQKIIATLTCYGPFYAWFTDVIYRENLKFYRVLSLFEVLLTEVHTCSGCDATGGQHIEITNPPARRRFIQLSSSDHNTFHGNFSDYFLNFISLDQPCVTGLNCWRTYHGTHICNGSRTDTRNIVTSLPVLLAIELQNSFDDFESDKNNEILQWNFPEKLYPDTQKSGTIHGLVYTLIGYGLVNTRGEPHFTVQYTSPNRESVYTYDDMKHSGRPVLVSKAKISTHLAGKNAQLPPGQAVHQAFYVLKGGQSAQDLFYERRSAALLRKFKVSMSSGLLKLPSTLFKVPGMVKMPAKARFWLNNPQASKYAEYLPVNAPEQKPLRISIDPESEDEVIDEQNTTHILDDTNILPHIETTHDTQDSGHSNVSSPYSFFDIDCRCGLSYDGNIHHDVMQYGEAIQCDECKEWSHIACQRDARAGRLTIRQKFICDKCDVRQLVPQRNSRARNVMVQRTMSNKPLKDRLWPGRGALARNGVFWYPVRLIIRQTGGWIVCWWKGNIFMDKSITPGQTSLVLMDDIRDSLWNDAPARRDIRLGQWKHAHDVETSEDILANPQSTPYTNDIDEALIPFKDELRRVLLEEDSKDHIPARNWLIKTKLPLDSLVPYCGSLSLNERAQIANWFEVHIAQNNKAARLLWLGKLPIAHAHTLYLSVRLKSHPKYGQLTHDKLVEQSWEALLNGVTSLHIDTDVDKECLARLEEEMFEVSQRAGLAGYYQWGLDAGDHQFWWPYKNTPEEWNHGDYIEDDDKIMRGPKYVENPELIIEAPNNIPKPRPRARKQK